MAEPFVGQIMMVPFNFAPKGWAICAGQLLSISQNTALFSLLGTQFGGNGQSNFALPNLQGQVAVGQGASSSGQAYDMGETGGSETVTLITSEMPSHNHGLNAVTEAGTVNAATGALLARPAKSSGRGSIVGNVYNPAAPDTPLAPSSGGTAGGSQPHNNLQPYLVLNYCIALQGIFPARS